MKPIMESWRKYLTEEAYYIDRGEEKGPISNDKVADDIIKYIKRFDPQYNADDVNLEFKKGVHVMRFTNFGPLQKRDKLIRALAKKGWVDTEDPVANKYYKRDEKFHRARTNFVHEDANGVRKPIVIHLDEGRSPFIKENIAFEELKDKLKQISEKLGNPKTLKIVFTDGEIQSDIYDVGPQATTIGKTGKADFSIGNSIFISHKDGMTPRDFGQFSGISKVSKLNKTAPVINFGEILNKIFKQLGLEDAKYPSSIDFQQAITDAELIMKAVFGRDYGPAQKSSPHNVDFVIQGTISLVPDVDPVSGEFTGAVRIGGDKIFSRNAATQNIESLDDFFKGGYLPALSVRRGGKGRNSFGITDARATIYAEAGRRPNFIITHGSTPTSIEFVNHKQDKRQQTNVRNFVNMLDSQHNVTPQNNRMLEKMLDSIANFKWKQNKKST